MSIAELLIIGLMADVALMLLVLAVSLRRHDMGWVDVGWAAGVGITVLLFALIPGPAPAWRRCAVGGLALIWSTRLALHILSHRVKNRIEDARYRSLRDRWGARARWYVPLLFLAEAPLITLFSIPALIALRSPLPAPGPWDILGLTVGLLAIAGESLADRQLEAFRTQPEHRGKTCRAGLWRYSRHPNYFFEWLHWWAYVLLAIGAPHAWLTLLGPLAMFVFLFRVTGIPHTERQALASRGDDYRRYQSETSAFFPWWPRKAAFPLEPAVPAGPSSL